MGYSEYSHWVHTHMGYSEYSHVLTWGTVSTHMGYSEYSECGRVVKSCFRSCGSTREVPPHPVRVPLGAPVGTLTAIIGTLAAIIGTLTAIIGTLTAIIGTLVAIEPP